MPGIIKGVSNLLSSLGGYLISSRSRISSSDNTLPKIKPSLSISNNDDSAILIKAHELTKGFGLSQYDMNLLMTISLESKENLTSFALSQFGYLDSLDFHQGKLPDEKFLYAKSNHGNRSDNIYLDDLDNQSRRLFIIDKFFKDNLNDYLNAFKSKLPYIAGFLFIRALVCLEDDKFENVIRFLSDEYSKDVLHTDKETPIYKWAKTFSDENREDAERILGHMRNGQRYYCRLLANDSRDGDDEVLGLINSWIQRSPDTFLKGLQALQQVEQDRNPGNKLSFELKDIEKQITSLHHYKNRQHYDEAISSKINSNVENLIKNLKEDVLKNCLEILEDEKDAVKELKRLQRRAFLKTTSKWAGTTLTLASLGGGGIYAVNYLIDQHFQSEITRINSKIAPFIRIDYARSYEQAKIEFGDTFPQEARDSRNIQQYTIQFNNHLDFLHALHNKYFKVLAVYLAPVIPENTRKLIQSSAILGLPNDLRENLPDDLRNLFTACEWNFPQGTRLVVPGQYYFGEMIGYGMTEAGVLRPGVLENRRGGNLSSIANFLHPQPFPSIQRESYIDPATRQRVYTNRFINPLPEREVFRGIEPREYIDTDVSYLNIVDACHEMLFRIERKKQEVITGFQNSPEVQEIHNLLKRASENRSIKEVEPQIDRVCQILEQKQKLLEPVLRGVARCECRLKDLLEVRIPKRVSDIKSRNSYRALIIE